MSWMHYALVAGVGALLGTVFRGASPAVVGAAIYTLGFWVRGRPQTQALLDRGVVVAHQQLTATQQFFADMRARNAANAAANPNPYTPPFIDPTTQGAGVEYRDDVRPGVYVAPNGRDTIDVGQY